ncbi:hypothetical protein EV363DRAFT_1193980, partial [Boletus edulis]
VPFSTWKQILKYGVDILLILEYSFYLHQQGVTQPLSSAAQKYKASGSQDGLRKALEEVFKQYDKASQAEKVDMITNVILQNHMYVEYITPTFHLLTVLYRRHTN